jgi:hypothetical protein
MNVKFHLMPIVSTNKPSSREISCQRIDPLIREAEAANAI